MTKATLTISLCDDTKHEYQDTEKWSYYPFITDNGALAVIAHARGEDPGFNFESSNRVVGTYGAGIWDYSRRDPQE